MFLSNLLFISLHPKVNILSLVSVFIYFVQVTEAERENFVTTFRETLKLPIEIKFFISLVQTT